jgi:hypothetical protein
MNVGTPVETRFRTGLGTGLRSRFETGLGTVRAVGRQIRPDLCGRLRSVPRDIGSSIRVDRTILDHGHIATSAADVRPYRAIRTVRIGRRPIISLDHDRLVAVGEIGAGIRVRAEIGGVRTRLRARLGSWIVRTGRRTAEAVSTDIFRFVQVYTSREQQPEKK